MNAIETVFKRMRSLSSTPALYWQQEVIDYDNLFDKIDEWDAWLSKKGIISGTVLGLYGDYSPGTIALIFALMHRKAIIVPITLASAPEMARIVRISGTEHLIRFHENDEWSHEVIKDAKQDELVSSFLNKKVPGLIVFTSGSTGEPKGILHDCERVMRKFVATRPGWRTVLFLMIDHFGGFNTLLGTFAYGGLGVCARDRTPEAICEAIEGSSATLLPTTPTFLNLLIGSSTWRRFDLNSIKLITYGTEVMPKITLQRSKSIFTKAKFKQTYGLSELGVLRSQSPGDDTTWVKVGGDGFETKIVDNTLWVRSEANMVGYLNAPNPFDENGWLNTGDEVEVRGDLIRFVGRNSEIINVGGRKVVPIEVEETLMLAENVVEASVTSKSHPLLGQVPSAYISLHHPENKEELTRRLRQFCKERLAKFKIPMRFEIIDTKAHRSERFKKNRQFKL